MAYREADDMYRIFLLLRIVTIRNAFLLIGFIVVHSVSAQETVWTKVSGTSPWTARDSAGEVVFQDRMWLLGGWTIDGDSFKRLNDVWSSADGKIWHNVLKKAPWPERNLAGSLVFRDKILIFGGLDGKKALNDVWYSADGSEWHESPEPVPWSPRLAFGYTVYDNKIWIAGGFDWETMTHYNDVWCSDDGIEWDLIVDKAPWSPRGMFPLVSYKGKMWLCGGGVYDEKSSNYHDVWSSVDGKAWIQVTEDAGWAERRFQIITEYRNELWLLGGVTDGNVNLNDIWRSADGVNWEIAEKAAPWGVRHEQMCLVFDERLWMFGGFSGDSAGEMVYGDTWIMR